MLSLTFSSIAPPGTHEHQNPAVVLVIILVTAALVSALFRKLRLDSIPGYLLAGALVGPHSLGLVRDTGAAEEISHLATVLLMFTIGLHLDFSSMRRGMVHILGVGIISTLLVTLALWGLALMLGVSRPAGLILAMGGAMSSTAVLVRILMNRRELQTQHGRVSLGIAIVQDLVSVVVLAVVPAVVLWAKQSGDHHSDPSAASSLPRWATVLITSGKGAGGVFLMLWGGRVLLPRLLHFVARLASQELVLIVCAALALLSAIWTSYIGFSPEMGAFIAGFLLAGTPFRYQLAGQLAPLRDLLLTIFFTGVGMKIVPSDVASNLGAVLIAFVGVMVMKTVIISLTGYVAGMSAPASLLTGVYLGNTGEFTLVIIGAGAAALAPVEQGVAITVVILSLIASPLLMSASHTAAEKLSGVKTVRWAKAGTLDDRHPHDDAPAAPDDQRSDASAAPGTDSQTPRKPGHVIIAGFGPVGRSLADRMTVLGVPFTVIELNARTVERQATLGRRIIYGDASNREVLEEAGVHKSDAVFLTLPDDEAVLLACHAVRELNPHVFLAARVKFLSGKVVAMQLGADCVTVEEVATAQSMERESLDALRQWLEKNQVSEHAPSTSSAAPVRHRPTTTAS